MRILFLLRHFPPERSGMATQMFNTVHFLKGQGADVKVVRLLFKSQGAEHKYVGESVKGSFFMEQKLRELKEKYKPDIVHFDSLWPAGRAITKVFQDEVKIISIGGRMFDEYGEYWKYTGSNKFIGWLKGQFLTFLAKDVLNKIDLVFSEGYDIEKHLKENGIVVPIKVINNGVDFSRFKYKPARGKRLLFFGRFSWENGPDRFVEILKGLPGFEGVMVGYGPKEDEVRKLAEKVTNVRVMDAVRWDQVPELLASVDGILLPFRRIGGISQTVTESMAAGRLVFTTRVGDLRSVIDPWKTGFFFSRDIEVRELIQKVYKDKKLMGRVEKAARQKIKKDFSWKVIIKEYLGAYREHHR